MIALRGLRSHFLPAIAAVPLLGTDGFLSTFYPVLSAALIVFAFGISLAIGLLAGSYPAWRAARLEPIEALRYE